MAENRSFWSRRKRTLIVLGVILVIALIVVFNLRSQREKTVKVTIAKVGTTDLTSIISASGEVKPKKNVEISALVPGRIIKIGVEEGDIVKAGDFLLKLDSTQYEAVAEGNRASIRSFRAQLIQDEARFRKDKGAYERQKRLFDEQLISFDQLETAKLQYDVSTAQVRGIKSQIENAEASLKSTMDNLNKTTFVSPIDGMITSLRVEEGEMAIIGTMNNPGTVLLTIADLSVMEVEVEVDETDVVGVQLGQSANVRVDAYPDTVFKGKVTEIGSSALQKADGDDPGIQGLQGRHHPGRPRPQAEAGPVRLGGHHHRREERRPGRPHLVARPEGKARRGQGAGRKPRREPGKKKASMRSRPGG